MIEYAKNLITSYPGTGNFLIDPINQKFGGQHISKSNIAKLSSMIGRDLK